MADLDAGALRADVVAAIRTLEGLFKTVTYRHVALGGYDPATGGPMRTVTEKTVRMQVSGYSALEKDGIAILRTDRRGFVVQADLLTEPTIHDEVAIDGKVWAVVGIDEDEVSARWELQLRRA